MLRDSCLPTTVLFLNKNDQEYAWSSITVFLKNSCGEKYIVNFQNVYMHALLLSCMARLKYPAGLTAPKSKKILAAVAVFVALLALCLVAANAFSNSSSAEKVFSENYIDYKVVNGNSETPYVKVVDYHGTSLALLVPETVVFDGVEYTVIEIGKSAFEGNASLTTLTLPAKLETIGESAFKKCNSLCELVLPDSLKEIKKSAFERNVSLTSLTLPAKLETIGELAFKNCSALCELKLPESLKTIKKYAFENIAITKLVIPEAVTKISTGIFKNCKSLESVSIPITLHYVGERVKAAFQGCHNMTSFTVTKGTGGYINYDGGGFLVGTDPPSAPWRQTLKDCSIVVEEGVETIGKSMFYQAEHIVSLTLPSTLKEIKDKAFSGCIGIKSLVLPDCTVQKEAFADCTGLNDITFGQMTSIHNSAFKGTNFFDSDGTPLSVNAETLRGHTFRGSNCNLYKSE